jgi:hypothetical protein
MVFALNPVAGFACSLGFDTGFNSRHHDSDEETEAVVHIHENGERHIHYEKKKDHSHPHSQTGDRKEHAEKEKQKDNCCTDQVIKFEELDKSIPQKPVVVHPTFLISIFDVFYQADLPANDIVRNIKQFVRSYHPPIPDIRIAIQSFQI